MKMRLQGTLPEIEAALARLRQIFEITYKSAPYKDRAGAGYRVYIEVKSPDNKKGRRRPPFLLPVHIHDIEHSG